MSGDWTPPAPLWGARLKCEHVARTRGRPRVGGYISCPEPGCRRQERVLLVWSLAVPELGQQGIQGTLWEEAA